MGIIIWLVYISRTRDIEQRPEYKLCIWKARFLAPELLSINPSYPTTAPGIDPEDG